MVLGLIRTTLRGRLLRSSKSQADWLLISAEWVSTSAAKADSLVPLAAGLKACSTLIVAHGMCASRDVRSMRRLLPLIHPLGALERASEGAGFETLDI